MSLAFVVRVSADSRMLANAVRDGGSGPTPLVSIFCSTSGGNRPVAVSMATTSWPRPRNAGMTWAALAIETSRSSLVPPNRTAIFIAPILTVAAAAVRAEFGRTDAETQSAGAADYRGRVCTAIQLLQALGWRVCR